MAASPPDRSATAKRLYVSADIQYWRGFQRFFCLCKTIPPLAGRGFEPVFAGCLHGFKLA